MPESWDKNIYIVAGLVFDIGMGLAEHLNKCFFKAIPRAVLGLDTFQFPYMNSEKKTYVITL